MTKKESGQKVLWRCRLERSGEIGFSIQRLAPEFPKRAIAPSRQWYYGIEQVRRIDPGLPPRSLGSCAKRNRDAARALCDAADDTDTRHSCVEGWSAIGKGSGALSDFLEVSALISRRLCRLKCARTTTTTASNDDSASSTDPAHVRVGEEIIRPYGSDEVENADPLVSRTNTTALITYQPRRFWEDQGYNWYSGS